jgi:hypothetical protein
MRHILTSGTGPHPHPATHSRILTWVAGWGCGPVPDLSNRHLPRAAVAGEAPAAVPPRPEPLYVQA